MTHVTWSVERGDKCSSCRGETVLIIAPTSWSIDVEDGGDDVEVHDEVSGHYCRTCERLVSLSLKAPGKGEKVTIYLGIHTEGTTLLAAEDEAAARIVFAQHFPHGQLLELCQHCGRCGRPRTSNEVVSVRCRCE